MSYDLIDYERVHKVLRGAFELHSRNRLILGELLKLLKGNSLFGCASSLEPLGPGYSGLNSSGGCVIKFGVSVVVKCRNTFKSKVGFILKWLLKVL